jgi:hypothetical protein
MRKNQYGFDIYIAGIPAMVRDARALPAVLIIRIRLKEPKGRCRLRRFSPQQFQQEISPPSFRKDFCDHLPGLSGIPINKWRDGFADPSRRAIQDRWSTRRYSRMQFSAVASLAWPRMNGR